MSSLLEEFFYGCISHEARAFKEGPQYQEISQVIEHLKEDILPTLAPNEKALFAKYTSAQEERAKLIAIQNQIHGYKLGLIFTAESFVTQRELFLQG